jgi:enoyl-CoA hydratase
MPHEIKHCVSLANADPRVRVIIVKGNGSFFCAGYDLKQSAEGSEQTPCTQKLPWSPKPDFAVMGTNAYPAGYTHCYMSLFESTKPTIALVHGGAIAGGSDIALCCDFVFATHDAKIGYPPTRLWGVPTTAMWALKCGMDIQKAKLLVFTGKLISGLEAERDFGIVLKSFPCAKSMREHALALAKNMASVPPNQMFMNKMVLNRIAHGTYGGSISAIQDFSTVFDGLSRHTPEGYGFSKMAQKHGFKSAIGIRDDGKDIISRLEHDPLGADDIKKFLRKRSKL